MRHISFAFVISCVFSSSALGQSTITEGFEDGPGNFFAFGGAQLSVDEVDPHTGSSHLTATDRTEPYEGPAIDLSALVPPGADADITVWVRMPVDATVKMTAKRTDGSGADQYESIGQIDVAAGEWSELSGSYSYEDGSAIAAYIESETLENIDIDEFGVVVSGGKDLSAPQTNVLSASDFEDGLGDWIARDAGGNPTLSVSDQAFEGTGSAMVSDRGGQGDGIGLDVSDIMKSDGSYTVSAQIRMMDADASGDIWMTMRRTTSDSESYDTLVQVAGVSGDEWIPVTFTYRMPQRDVAFMYFETAYPDGTTEPFLIDNVVIEETTGDAIQDLTSIQETAPFALGVAIDARETEGTAGDLTAHHFGQLTPENHMKPDAWYDADRTYVIHPDARAIMDFAQTNDMNVYGHTLLWHRQNPDWFFLGDDGAPLTSSPEDQEFLRQRLRDHIFAVARLLSEQYGAFGSETNPLVAFDVVNEVIADGAGHADGLRRSAWYEVLGPDYIDLAFEFADEAFNKTYADPSVDRPVMLAINDYNTEYGDKRGRMKGQVEGMLERGVPVDIIGHQFHINLTVPAEALDTALSDLGELGLKQAVTELDIPTGTPVTEALLIDQAYLYADAFDVFRSYGDDLYSVSVWGLTDDRSWLADRGDALIFNEAKQAKPAYFGVLGDELPPRQRSAFAFAIEGELAADSVDWQRLPLLEIDADTGFQTRWTESGLLVWMTTADPSVDTGDKFTLNTADAAYDIGRDGTSDIPSEVVEIEGGWTALATVPFDGLTLAEQIQADVSVTNDETITGWSGEGGLGTITLVEPVSFAQAASASDSILIDGVVEGAWDSAPVLSPQTTIQGDDTGASGEFSFMWNDDTLYVLASIMDETPDTSSSDPWEHDSVEVFLDLGNSKNGAYLGDDAQIRVSRDNVVSFGAGNSDPDRIESAVSEVDGGYIVEMAIDMMGQGGEGTFHGIDVQVNDGIGGERISVRTWAEPTGTGYQTNARWGVLKLISAD